MLILCDNQDITRVGLQWLCNDMKYNDIAFAADKAALAKLLDEQEHAAVVLDYTLFDFASFDELLIWQQRFQSVQWLFFSETLTNDLVRLVVASSPRFGIILKDAPLPKIRQALHDTLRGEPYRYAPLVQMADEQRQEEERVKLTKTEMEILRDIALGLTTKEIAEKRFSSFHTVNTHRKNIFRKLNVNNIHEATKYALRAGMVDAAEYYI